MRSFAVVAGFAAAANAYAYGYPPAYNTTSVAPPTYETSSAPVYPSYPESSKAPEYPSYPESSKAPAYPEYPSYTTTEVKYGLTTVCPEPTTVTYGTKTYTVKSSTTIIDEDCEYTTTYEVKPTPSAAYPTYTPPAYTPKEPVYPTKNATTPYPTGVKPSSTKPTTPEFTGAAAQAGVGLLAVVGAMAAFL
ncbi:hypothetical protein IQ07DRAFT_591862 [Pyrenochaeta sp. DS3sAY3a]|nr:hypothetical protein IQ07DRAFT_591862 [Pyrenochaeta sp. DS3sAY3a]